MSIGVQYSTVMARFLLRAILLYSVHRLFVQAPLVPQAFRSLLGAGQRIEKLGTSEPAEPSAGPSSRAANWDRSRTDTEFRRKCERFRQTLRGAGPRGDGSERVIIRRGKIFEDTFKETIDFDTQGWKNRWKISFEDDRGYGIGVQREWYTALMRSTVDTKLQLFVPSDGDRDAYTINPHKSASDATMRRFVIEDPRYYQSLQFIRENDVGQIKKALRQSLKWTVEVVEGGKTVERELRPRGRNMKVTNDEKEDYVQRVCEMKLHTVIEKQLGAFLTGFYEIIPKTMISIFDERELELVISGPPWIDVNDWKNNTVYVGYTADSPTIQWFWETLLSFNQEQLGQFLHYVTGSSKPPLRGFAHLDGSDEGFRRFRISKDGVLKASVCGYLLSLPSYFETKEDLEHVLLAIIGSFSHGFSSS